VQIAGKQRAKRSRRGIVVTAECSYLDSFSVNTMHKYLLRRTTPAQSFSGATLLELMFALALIQAILCSALLWAKQSLMLFRRIAQEQAATAQQQKLRRILDYGLQRTNSRFALTALRVHQGGEIRDIYGRRHPVHAGPSSTQPDPNSSAVSFLHLDPRIILQTSRSSGANSLYLCAARNTPPAELKRITSSSSWAAVSADGFIEVHGKLRRRGAPAAVCPGGTAFSAALRIPASPMFGDWQSANRSPTTPLFEEQSQKIFDRALVFIPTTNNYSIYAAHRGGLRYLAHDKQENQPVDRRVLQFRLNENSTPNQRLLHAIFQLSGSRKIAKEILEIVLPLAAHEGHSTVDLLF